MCHFKCPILAQLHLAHIRTVAVSEEKFFVANSKKKFFWEKNLTRVRLRLEIRRKLDILELACVTVFDSIFAAKHPIAIYYSTIAVCALVLYCLEEKFNFRSPFLDRLISGGLSSPISLPATATCLTTDWLLQSICSFKVSIKASTLRNRLWLFSRLIDVQIYLFIFFLSRTVWSYAGGTLQIDIQCVLWYWI